MCGDDMCARLPAVLPSMMSLMMVLRLWLPPAPPPHPSPTPVFTSQMSQTFQLDTSKLPLGKLSKVSFWPSSRRRSNCAQLLLHASSSARTCACP
jgi:hypothetical protein